MQTPEIPGLAAGRHVYCRKVCERLCFVWCKKYPKPFKTFRGNTNYWWSERGSKSLTSISPGQGGNLTMGPHSLKLISRYSFEYSLWISFPDMNGNSCEDFCILKHSNKWVCSEKTSLILKRDKFVVGILLVHLASSVCPFCPLSLKTLDTFGNCQKSVSLCVSPHKMHKITNLWKIELYWT